MPRGWQLHRRAPRPPPAAVGDRPPPPPPPMMAGGGGWGSAARSGQRRPPRQAVTSTKKVQGHAPPHDSSRRGSACPVVGWPRLERSPSQLHTTPAAASPPRPPPLLSPSRWVGRGGRWRPPATLTKSRSTPLAPGTWRRPAPPPRRHERWAGEPAARLRGTRPGCGGL